MVNSKISPSRFALLRRRPLASAALALMLCALALAGVWRYGFKPEPAAAPQAARAATLQCPLPLQPAVAPHPGMVWVPGGSFAWGAGLYPEEQGAGTAQVAGFWMDRTEVTNDQFAEFVRATGYVTTAEKPVDPKLHPGLDAKLQQAGAVVFRAPAKVDGQSDMAQWWQYTPGAFWRKPGGPDTGIDKRGAFPVVAVTFEDARAYAQWKGRSLPTEAQWEWAARAGQAQVLEDHEQPRHANTWQGIFPVINSADDGFSGVAPVGCFEPNALGLFDMIGNVWEITRDVYSPRRHARGEPGPDEVSPALRGGGAASRVIKGGSFLCSSDYCMRYRAGSRQPQEDDLAVSHLGFRTVLLAPGPKP